MLHLSDPRYQYCTRVGKSVCVCRSEVECRREHGCTKAYCPLETAFGQQAFDEGACEPLRQPSTSGLWVLSSRIFP